MLPVAASHEPLISVWQPQGPTITAASLDPPHVPPAKPWHRVPVPALNRRHKIWKRSGGFDVAAGTQYATALAELVSRGEVARKRLRKADFVPAWGEGTWDPDMRKSEDGRMGLLETRGTLNAATNLAEQSPDRMAQGIVRQSIPTYAHDSSRWIPRKRHNTGWPIESCQVRSTSMAGKLQPLLEIVLPIKNKEASDAPDISKKADDNEMRRRSTRRLSRRISLAHIEDMSSNSHDMSGPLRKPIPTSLTPRKVSSSPQRAFTVTATPCKVVFDALLGSRTPTRLSSSKQATLSPVPEAVLQTLDYISESSPVVFDQPPPTSLAQPEHESMRRVSLHNARRLDRRSSIFQRHVGFDRVAPVRRHSLFPMSVGHADIKLRRHTLDLFCVECGNVGQEDERRQRIHDSQPVNLHQYNASTAVEPNSEQGAVTVDVGTNLDIFGHCPPLASEPSESATATASHDVLVPEAGKIDLPVIDSMPTSGNDLACLVDNFPFRNALGLPLSPTGRMATIVAEQSTMAPTSTGDGKLAVSDGASTCDSPSSPGTDNRATSTLQQGGNYQIVPHDHDGLSTIIEEPVATIIVGASAKCHLTTANAVNIPRALEDSDRSILSVLTLSEHEEPSEVPQALANDQHESYDGSFAPQAPAQGATIGSNLSADLDEVNHYLEVNPQANGTSRSTADAEGSVCDISPKKLLTTAMTESAEPLSSSNDCGETSKDIVCELININHAALRRQDAEVSLKGGALETNDGSVANTDVESEGSDDRRNTSHARLPKRGVCFALDIPPSTPPDRAAAHCNEAESTDTEMIMETPPGRSTAFMPINGTQSGCSLPSYCLEDDPAEDDEDFPEDGVILAMDYEPTVQLEEIAPNLTEELTAQGCTDSVQHSDSEMEMLRQFVTRVRADKNAKAAAAALVKRTLRPKRRSGSTGSITSATGSPVAKSSDAERLGLPLKRSRPPLVAKDLNSPSPVKRKRKQTAAKDKEHFKGKTTIFSEDISPQPARTSKRRRKRLDAELETTLDGSLSLGEAEPVPAGGPRRSTRSSRSLVALKPAAATANSITLSMIPVRFSGASMAELDRDMPAVVIPRAAAARSEEKDLAAATRVNTRKNKGNSVPPRMVLAHQAEDPVGWRIRESKSSFDARSEKEPGYAEIVDDDAQAGDLRRAQRTKGVRWAEDLVRFQGDGVPPGSQSLKPVIVTSFTPAAPELDIMPTTAELAPTISQLETPTIVPDEIREPEQPAMVTIAGAQRGAPKRARASRLQQPTPIRSKLEAENILRPVAPTQAHLPLMAATEKATSAGPASLARMTTRRTRIASLGLSANGTPAPKRRAKS